jgi:hypothetical protein
MLARHPVLEAETDNAPIWADAPVVTSAGDDEVAGRRPDPRIDANTTEARP